MSDPVWGHPVADPWPSVWSWWPNHGFRDGEHRWLAHLWQAKSFFTLRVRQGASYSILMLRKLRLRKMKLPQVIQGKWPYSPKKIPLSSSAQVTPGGGCLDRCPNHSVHRYHRPTILSVVFLPLVVTSLVSILKAGHFFFDKMQDHFTGPLPLINYFY